MDTREVTEILLITCTAQQPRKASPNCPLHQQQVSVSDGGTLTSPVDIIKGEIKFVRLALGGGWVGRGGDLPSQSLSFLEQSLARTLTPEDLWSRRHGRVPRLRGWSKALPPGDLWSRRHDPVPRLHPCRSLGWSPGPHSLGAGLDLEVQGEPWFGSLGEVAELYKRA